MLANLIRDAFWEPSPYCENLIRDAFWEPSPYCENLIRDAFWEPSPYCGNLIRDVIVSRERLRGQGLLKAAKTFFEAGAFYGVAFVVQMASKRPGPFMGPMAF